MLASLLAGSLMRRRIHYSWIVASVTFLTMLVMAGAVGAPGVFIVPLQNEFGWQTADISSALAIRFALFGLMGPFAGAFMNHFGMRKVMVTAIVVVMIGFGGSLLFMTEFWQLVLCWGVLVGAGTGLTAMVLGATVATRWFSSRRGLIIGLLAASSATGQLVFLPLLARLTENFGWRTALAFICVMLAVAVVAVLALMRDHPADLGLPLYGETEPQAISAKTGTLRQMLLMPLTVLRDVSGSMTFWILFATFFICGASTSGLIQTHFVTMCGDFGLLATSAAGLLAVMGIFDFIGTVGSGWLSDRYDNRWLLFMYYGLRGVALIILPFTDFAVFGLSIFAILYGLDWIATVPPTIKLTAATFGVQRANIVFGWIFAAHQLGAAFAAYGAGMIRTVLATYTPSFFIAGMLCFIAALVALAIARPAPITGNAR
ncbi:MFS transporter [Pseudomonas syringae]|uniref:MFS transporter n=1 Tax=Pseudomonas syringae TaxID=317 RepID=A0A1C7ZAC8_PSESX|nr:MFS transporter [Pseudomonas syringae]